ncbi:helix-turn-helix transcriptional regulator [Kitasatospora sp. CM 4170]|uniref:Helix-turn-helix domain-containing protein n=1 Tax=Kitasatospora aburaviensis TaxID=67265 RepID=A0ABW1F7T5_9ACTN|nr:helix-turn-helix transcriptional regulator [Kitasatospora sp. CM 4170]WNM49866.1 helix-turn-helix transcriptional regulator [Kitasatospora sp. CM 4170]
MVNRKQLDPTSGPWAPFGVQLRRSREARGLTQAQLARKVGFDPSYVSYAELASREPPSERFARRADEALETGGTLLLMWLQNKHSALLEGFPEYANHEAKAAEIRIFESGVVPGLFQTEAYAMALAMADVRRGTITRAQAEERVTFLLVRQQLLGRVSPPLVHAVLDESCLRRPIGGGDVMKDQLMALEELFEAGHVILQVAPFDMAEHRPFALPMVLLSLPDQSLLGYSESEGRSHLERDSDRLAAWRRHYDRLQVGALAEMATLEWIRAVREGTSCPTST